MMFTRHPNNPLISPSDVRPSRADFEVVGTFNAGVALFNDEVILLLRVSERPQKQELNFILCPYLSTAGEITIKRVRVDDPEWDTTDSRKVQHIATGEMFLTSISHLRLARSADGVQFTIESEPWLAPDTNYERFGVEDCRITQIEDTYYVNYSAVSPYGVSTALVSTKDFITIERHGLIFPPANRNVSIFPEKINGQYICYHRPMPGMFGSMNVWIGRSPDLLHWGEYETVVNAQRDGWQSGRVGSGAPPIKTEKGWLSIYHAADRENYYSLGAFITPLDDPATIIYKSHEPILYPQEAYETNGFFGNVVFTCGAIVKGEMLYLYYGSADEHIALAEVSLDVLLKVTD